MKSIAKKLRIPLWLTILLFVFFLLRVPSFFEPYSYGDEMIYLTLGQGVRQGIPLYSQLHDNKPPLLYIVAAVAGNLFWFKAILSAWILTTVVFFWKLAKALYPKNEKLQKVAVSVFGIFTTIPLLEGNIANAELFMIGPIIYGFLILLTQKLSPRNLIKAGLAFSVATLFKVPAAFDIGAILVFWVITGGIKKTNIVASVKNFAYILLGFLIPILFTLVWYAFHGALPEYFVAAFLQNLGYLSTWRGEVQAPFFIRNIPLFVRFGIVVVTLGIVFWKKKYLSREFIFLTCWLAFALFAVTLSERPYPHYLIQAIAPISFFLGILFTEKNLMQTLAIIPLAISTFVPVYYKYWNYSTYAYYARFVNFFQGKISKETYLSSFNKSVPRNYDIANFISSITKPEEKVLVWGDSATIYALSRRLPPIKYVADYHIKDFSSLDEIIIQITETPPTVVVVLPEAENFPKLHSLLREKYILLTIIDGAEIWKVLSLNAQSAIITSTF